MAEHKKNLHKRTAYDGKNMRIEDQQVRSSLLSAIHQRVTLKRLLNLSLHDSNVKKMMTTILSMDDESGHPRQKTTEGERAHTHCTLMTLSVFRVVSGRY